ncbi:MAG: crossover junction endodeoxyribonuclease RuvC [Myxococcota bacterium]
MRVLGIDPGSTVTGFGVVDKQRGRLRLVAGGFVRTSAKQPMAERLRLIHEGLVKALATYAPDEVAIESIFKHKSAESAIRLGHARGVAMLAVAQAGFDPAEYNPMTIKRTVGAHGRADKDAIAKMVKMLLGELPDGPADVADALAIAICHHNHSRVAHARKAAGMPR